MELCKPDSSVNLLRLAIEATGGYEQLARSTRIARRRLHKIRDGDALTPTEELVLRHLIAHVHTTAATDPGQDPR